MDEVASCNRVGDCCRTSHILSGSFQQPIVLDGVFHRVDGFQHFVLRPGPEPKKQMSQQHLRCLSGNEVTTRGVVCALMLWGSAARGFFRRKRGGGRSMQRPASRRIRLSSHIIQLTNLSCFSDDQKQQAYDVDGSEIRPTTWDFNKKPVFYSKNPPTLPEKS